MSTKTPNKQYEYSLMFTTPAKARRRRCIRRGVAVAALVATMFLPGVIDDIDPSGPCSTTWLC